MARPRKPAGKPKPAGRKRDYRAEYARRQQRAREAGFTSYYQRRVAGTTAGPERARARGHRSRSDFLRELGEGDLIIMPEGIQNVVLDERGRYRRIVKLVIDAENGNARTYILRNLTRAQLEQTIAEEERKGAVWSPAPSLDQRRLVGW